MRYRSLLLAVALPVVLLGTAVVWMLGSSLVAVTLHRVALSDVDAQAMSLRAAPGHAFAPAEYERRMGAFMARNFELVSATADAR